MGFIRCLLAVVLLFTCFFGKGQTVVSYPAQSSQALKATAADVAMLLQQATPAIQFSSAVYSSIPQTGIIFIYDSTIRHNQACRVVSDGNSYIKFYAPEDNGLCYGVYQYLQHLGFTFYLPGSIWEQIPSLVNVYRAIDTTFATKYKYNNWFISGGHRQWIMDNDASYNWDTYNGINGHNWSLYQRRNRMGGQHRFAGHRSDIITGANLATWQNNPCYIASNNNSRAANSRSVPDVNNAAARQLWASTIEQKYKDYSNTILNNPGLYTGQFRNFKYGNANVSIEVPDGALWGNTTDNLGCIGAGYASASDQSITLANHTAQQIGSLHPDLRFQLYAYSSHADVPSASLPINDKLDIQLVPAVYHNLTSANGLRNRWYNRTKNISEYNYLNLSSWSGETPSFYLSEFVSTLQVTKDKKSQGLVWEASPAKFGSLPFLRAANSFLLDDISVDSSLRQFCNDMFAGAGTTVFKLLQHWTDNKTMTGVAGVKYKIPLFIQLVETAESKLANEPEIYKERLRELKAYLHYMVLFFDIVTDQRSNNAKMDKAAALCMYLAKTNRLQLVNSNYMIQVITRTYINNTSFYQQYNNITGTAYQNGNLPLITAAEIEQDFQQDRMLYGNAVHNYQYESAENIATKFDGAGIDPLKKISVQLNYTNGIDYYNRSEFNIRAQGAGSFTINYQPRFDMPGIGYINFLVESTDKSLEVLEDFTIDQTAGDGSLTVKLPTAGNYKLTISTKFKSAVKLDITTNKNFFYKQNVFLGGITDTYEAKSASLPGYFFIPKGVTKVYFSIENSNPGGAGFASADKINSHLAILDNKGIAVKARFVTPNDSALFCMDLPLEHTGNFYRFTSKSAYRLSFANISNMMWFAEPQPLPCKAAEFTISVVSRLGSCITQAKANQLTGSLNWEVTDQGKTVYYQNRQMIDLPANSSPNTVITLINGEACRSSVVLKNDPGFVNGMQTCASGGTMAEAQVVPVVYPNPGTGVYRCRQNGVDVIADYLLILNQQGDRVALFARVTQFNISHLPAGQYWYKMNSGTREFSGKLIKL